MKLPFALVAMLAVIPTVAGQSTQEEFNDGLWGAGAVGSTELYLVDGFTDGSLGSFTHEVFSARLDTRDRQTNGTWVLIIAAAYSITQNSAGAWQWQVSLDGTDIPGCRWGLQTINSQSGLNAVTTVSHPNLQIVCRVAEPAYGIHELGVTRTAPTGTPAAIQHATTSVNILNNDPVILSMQSSFEAVTGLSALEFLLFPAIVLLCIVLWSRSKDPVASIFVATLCVAAGLLLVGITVASGAGVHWIGMLPLGTIMAVMGGYMAMREGIDQLRGAR